MTDKLKIAARVFWDLIMENFDHSREGCYARALRRGDKICIYGSGGICRVWENYTAEDRAKMIDQCEIKE